ncbi:MAG: SpoVG family protein [Candidatus Saccharibacteria bacterium]|nr:SpoVG family protein [Candidatus Saccharibacteria bacterium]
MKISEVKICPVKPQDGLVAFASVVIDDNIYLGSIAVYTRLDGSYRILYPTKRIGTKYLNVFHPINSECGKQLENLIIKKCNELFERSNDDRHGKTDYELI